MESVSSSILLKTISFATLLIYPFYNLKYTVYQGKCFYADSPESVFVNNSCVSSEGKFEMCGDLNFSNIEIIIE